MVDTSGQANIRGIDINKLALGFADEESIFGNFVIQTTTSAREIRWYAKTAGFLDSTDTTGITTSQIANVPQKARPVVVEQSWTRNTSYIRKYFVESIYLTDEDIKDSDIDILATNIRDLVRAVKNQEDIRIWDVITESRLQVNINLRQVSGAWDGAYASMNPILDIMKAKQLIRSQGYNPEGAVLALNATDHMYLLNYLIDSKGSSIPSWSSGKMESGVVMQILGVRVIVSENVTADYACMWIPDRAATWKTFIPLTTKTIEDAGIGTKVRIWSEGECILHDPKAVCLLSGTRT